MKENGMKIPIREMAKDTRSGLMALFMRVIGKMTKQMEEGD